MNTLPPGILWRRSGLPLRAQIFLAAALLLLAVGIPLVLSASIVRDHYALGEPYYHLARQCLGACLGLGAAAAVAAIYPRFWLPCAPLAFVFCLLLLAALFVPGLAPVKNGARRWFEVAGFSFQPSELMKVVLPLFIAWGYPYPSSIGGVSAAGSSALPELTAARNRRLRWLLLALVAPVLLIAAQPDLGTALFVLAVSGSLLLVAGLPLRYPIYASLAALPVAAAVFVWRKPVILKRIDGFLAPQTVPQVDRSLMGVAGGGLDGSGVGTGMAKTGYLPEAHNDFIFAIFSEETGFVGVLLLLLLYSVVLQSGWRIVRRCPDPALRLLSLGIVLNIVFQACINIAVATASAPTKGIPLPFLSYGSSGLTVLLLQVGLLLSIARVTSAGSDEARR